MNAFSLRVLWLWAGGLATLLCLLFLPFTPGWRGIAVAAVVVATLIAVLRVGRRPEALVEPSFAGLPPVAYRLPVILVCGDAAGWPGETAVHQTAQGCWLSVAPHQTLSEVVCQLLWLRPTWTGQLAVMVHVNPQQQANEAALAQWLYALRWQMTQLRGKVHRDIPLVLSGQVAGAFVTQSCWQAAFPGEPVRVWRDKCAPCRVTDWVKHDASGLRLQQQIMLNALADWFEQCVAPAFTAEHPDVPSVLPFAVFFHASPRMSGALPASVWRHWLASRTALAQVAGWHPLPATALESSPLPDVLLAQLPRGHGITPGQQGARHALTLFTLAAMIALCSSAWNNRQLLHRMTFDIGQYHHLAMGNAALNADAVTALEHDAALLNEWARNGEPLRLSLGLYQGGHLRLPVLGAIQSSALPPSSSTPLPPSEPTAQVVRLDSLSLFDVGQWRLKAGAPRVLMDALVNINVKSGWLVVVTGHTDDIGETASNQALSLKRAVSVRDWMRDIGGIPESCFAVRGEGESRPLVSNETDAGRAANRRVEISLVPQADACQARAQ